MENDTMAPPGEGKQLPPNLPCLGLQRNPLGQSKDCIEGDRKSSQQKPSSLELFSQKEEEREISIYT